MATHTLDPTAGTVTDVLSRDADPVLSIASGDQVTIATLDAFGHLRRPAAPGASTPTMFPADRGHCLTGPIAVEGAGPGMVLAVRFVSIQAADWGLTRFTPRDNPLNRRLGMVGGDPSFLLWDIDAVGRTATNHLGHTIDVRPFLGVVGMPPNRPGEHSTTPPRADGGGNIDCRELVAGSTLYLPITTANALLCLGDGHAAQGDGEVGGTAIECGMTATVRIDVLDDAAIPAIHAVTPAGRITFGFDADLNAATAAALASMLDWTQALLDIDRRTAIMLASTAVSLRITQVANEVWGVHALLPTNSIRDSAGRVG